jgi:hypothetical protein
MIRKCTCKHKYQDEKYGKGRRVHNEMKPRSGDKECRCTVCSCIKKS